MKFSILNLYALLAQPLLLSGFLSKVHVHSNLQLPKGMISTALTEVSVFCVFHSTLFFLL